MGISLLAGPANVIMQLARPAVGYGVQESRVESGRIDRHPIKRARTTFTYLAVAIAGNDAQKAAFRRAVNGAHAQVYSTPESPVPYNAFDPDLQLWVAACIYKGGVDVHRTFVGELDERGRRAQLSRGQDAGHHLAGAGGDVAGGPGCIRPLLAASRWPRFTSTTPSATTCIRSPCRVMRGVALPRPLRRLPESIDLLITTGFLPQRFRDEMRLPWDAVRQRRFDRLMAVLGAVNRMLPRFVRAVSVQRAALGSGPPDQDGAPPGLTPARDRASG